MSHVKKVTQSASVEEAKPQPVDNPYWRQELEDLDRYFPRPTEAEEKQHADEQLLKHDGTINKIETQLATLKSMLTDLYLNGGEKRRVARQIERVEGDLVSAKSRKERFINLSGASIRTARELEPKRERWEELTARRKRVDAAVSKAKEWRPRGW